MSIYILHVHKCSFNDHFHYVFEYYFDGGEKEDTIISSVDYDERIWSTGT